MSSRGRAAAMGAGPTAVAATPEAATRGAAAVVALPSAKAAQAARALRVGTAFDAKRLAWNFRLAQTAKAGLADG